MTNPDIAGFVSGHGFSRAENGFKKRGTLQAAEKLALSHGFERARIHPRQ
jgi:hypothetical protein